MPERENLLGDYLRARREQLDPSDFPLVPGRRRVKGLRREELAHLAGVSENYYSRLEQGRDRRPSASVVSALAAIVCPDGESRAHLERLAGLDMTFRRRHDTSPESVSPELQLLLKQWTHQAALVLGRYRDVLAANGLATAINPHFVVSNNLMLEVFLDPAARTTYPDWDVVARQGVAALRASVGADEGDSARDELVARLSAGSPVFERLWSRFDVRQKPSGRQRFHHPTVGVLDLRYEPFTLPHDDRHTLYVFYADADSADAHRIQQLIDGTQVSATAGDTLAAYPRTPTP